MVIRTVLIVTIAASTACSYRASFVDCEISCTQSTGCPPGFTCSASEGVCRSGATATSCSTILDGGVDGNVDGGVDGGATSCPAVFGGSRYLFVNMNVTWPNAETYCTSLDTTPGAPYVHLVVVSNAGELGQLPVPTGLVCGGEACQPWLGYTDSKLNPGGAVDPAKFRWITDEPPPVLTTWASGQPDESSGSRCAYRDSGDGLMHDRTCSNLRQILCECDQFPEHPNSF